MPGAEHFVVAPNWEWYILGYFFLAGLTGGCYAIATLLRHWGGEAEAGLWRWGYLASLPLLVLCPILLTVDLGSPQLFWHMLIGTTPGAGGPNFKYWSPMSVGVWALLAFGVFSLVSFVEALVLGRVIRHPLGGVLARALGGGFGLAFNVAGAVLGMFVASYTGVLLMVSNQPVWSDTWMLGGLFLASGLSGSVALLELLRRWRRLTDSLIGSGAARGMAEAWLRVAAGYFAVLELVFAIVFLLSLVPMGALARTLGFPWLLLWVLVLITFLPALGGLVGARLTGVRGQAVLTPERAVVVGSTLTLVGVLALRFVIIFSAQAT